MFNHLERFLDSLWEKFRKEDTIRITSKPPPWDSWELDPKFFKVLSQWTLDHQESTLDSVLERVRSGIEKGESLIELIPESPFPARSLVTALAYLLKLGMTISAAKGAVQEFAKQVMHWVLEVQYAFVGPRSGRFTRAAKKNLAQIRTLIDEICKWATMRLNDGRWSSIKNGLGIAREIDEFKSRITSARALFVDLSFLEVSKGIDVILQEIESVRKLQQDQLKGIHDKLDAQKETETRREFLARMLVNVANPSYNEQGKIPCDADTRVEILAEIDAWIYDKSTNGANFLWLTGDPGSGKSAITASIARDCKDAGILWAQFFINRNIAETTDPTSYFPFIARQFADHSPDSDVALAIYEALKKRPSLVDAISTDQASGLFVDVIDVASRSNPDKPVVVVIDGLDETSRSRLRETADIFSQLFVRLAGRNAKVLISSRTDEDIRTPFTKMFNNQRVKHLHLDTSAPSSIRDVSTYLAKRIGYIVEKNNLNWTQWPGEQRMQALCDRASGLFIWAVTVVKFFEEQIDKSGTERLNLLLDVFSVKGMGDINHLYHTILQLMYTDETDYWAFETFRRIVGCIVALREPLCIAGIKDLLDLRQDSSSDPVDVVHFVRRLRTVLVAGADAIDGQTVPRLHKSFFEFITSDRAGDYFRVNPDGSNGELTMQCIRQLVNCSSKHAPPDLMTDTGFLPVELRYAMKFWDSHLGQAGGGMPGICGIDGSIQICELNDLLRSSSALHCNPLSITLSSDTKKYVLISHETEIGRWEMPSGMMQRASMPFKRAGHDGTKSDFPVAFSYDGKQVASHGLDDSIHIWDIQSGQPMGLPCMGHTGDVSTLAFSPDSKHLVSGGDDCTVRMWDSQTGRPIWSSKNGHTDTVRSVAFSPDGRQVASCGDDHVIHLWESISGQRMEPSFAPLGEFMLSVAFSPDGKLLVSSGLHGLVCLLDAQSGQHFGSPLLDNNSDLLKKWDSSHFVDSDFSPDGNQIISLHGGGTIRLWNRESGELIRHFKKHNDPARCIRFSPSGKRVVTGGGGGTVCLWDIHNGQPVGEPFVGPTDAVCSVAFSPDGKRIMAASIYGVIHIWNIHTRLPIAFNCHTIQITHVLISSDVILSASIEDDTVRFLDPQTGLPMNLSLIGDTKGILVMALSPDGSRIAAASMNNTVSLWDVRTRQLVSSAMPHPIIGFTSSLSLRFSPDSTRLVLACIDGAICTWNAVDGSPTGVSPPLGPLHDRKAISFDLKHGWRSDVEQSSSEALMRWFPFDNPDAGLWAFVDGKLIRSNGSGSLTIINTRATEQQPEVEKIVDTMANEQQPGLVKTKFSDLLF